MPCCPFPGRPAVGRRRNARDAGLRGEALGGAGARACADHCAYGGMSRPSRGGLSLGRRLPVRSLSLSTLAEKDVEVLLRGLAKAGSSSKPPDEALEEVGARTGRTQARALGGMANRGDRGSALLPGGDDKALLPEEGAPRAKPRGRGDGRGGRPGLAGREEQRAAA